MTTPAIPLTDRRDVANLIRAIDVLWEVAAKRRKAKALGPLERRLVAALRRAFKAQERELLKRFAKAKKRFTAAEAYEWNRIGMMQEAAEPDWDELLDEALLATIQGFLGPLEQFIALAISAGATEVLAQLSITDAFDLPNPRAAGYAENYAAELVSKINDTTKQQLRKIIADGIEQGKSYNQIAKELRTRYQQFHTPSPLKHIQDRATLIATTELGNAYEAGNEATVKQLQDGGLTMEVSWLTVNDDRVSDECRSNQAAGWIPFGDAFPSGHQRPLAHPGCRCTALYRRKPSE